MRTFFFSFFFSFFFLLVLIPFSPYALAASISDCEDTPTCICSPEDPAPADASITFSSAESCKNYCDIVSEEYEDVDEYTLQCSIDGTLTVIDQGSISFLAGAANVAAGDNYIEPDLGVDIPGLSFDGFQSDGESVVSNHIGLYIAAVYEYLLIVGGLVAVLLLMIAGMQWMLARGDSGRIQKAKDRIRNAVTGIVLLLLAATIASLVDPALLSYDSLSVSYVNPEEYLDESPDLAGAVDFSQIDVNVSGEINCDASYSVQEIALSTVGLVTYRYGGKGGPPEYEAETKTDPNGVPYSSYCPPGTICLDCSGYADFLRQCAGLPAAGESGGTRGIFDTSDGAEEVEDWNGGTSINGEELEPGDMIGYPGHHVFIYIGDGNVADSHGSGRSPGDAIGIYDVSYAINLYLETDRTPYIRRR